MILRVLSVLCGIVDSNSYPVIAAFVGGLTYLRDGSAWSAGTLRYRHLLNARELLVVAKWDMNIRCFDLYTERCIRRPSQLVRQLLIEDYTSL